MGTGKSLIPLIEKSLPDMNTFYRLRFFCCCFLVCCAFLSTAQTDSGTLTLSFAGLPQAEKMASGRRLFFTVLEDFYSEGRLLVAAGARAVGRLQHFACAEGYWEFVIKAEAVQCVEGPMITLKTDLVRIFGTRAELEVLRWQAALGGQALAAGSIERAK
jgi:hypothetical protein